MKVNVDVDDTAGRVVMGRMLVSGNISFDRT